MLSNVVFAQSKNLKLIVGSYTKSCGGSGLHVYNFDSKSGVCTKIENDIQTVNPSYVALSANRKKVFAVNENGGESTISDFGFDPKTGKLTSNTIQSNPGADPCHLITNASHTFVANYSGGSISVFGKSPDGSLGTLQQVVQHVGSSSNPKRQQSPHVHMVQFTPDQKHVLAADLGTDKVYLYSYNPKSTSDVLVLKSSIDLPKGSGPRHLVVSKNGKFVYVLQELSGQISVLRLSDGALTIQSTASVLKTIDSTDATAAAIKISPDGRFLYASNRAPANDLSMFKINANGDLQFVTRTPTLGDGPRDFTIDPSGKFLLVANQKSNKVVVFNRNLKNGLLIDTGQRVEVCSPTCVIFE